MTGTTLSGATNANTVAALQGIAREIIISPATSTTLYNLEITNDKAALKLHGEFARINGIV